MEKFLRKLKTLSLPSKCKRLPILMKFALSLSLLINKCAALNKSHKMPGLLDFVVILLTTLMLTEMELQTMESALFALSYGLVLTLSSRMVNGTRFTLEMDISSSRVNQLTSLFSLHLSWMILLNTKMVPNLLPLRSHQQKSLKVVKLEMMLKKTNDSMYFYIFIL